MTHKIVTHTFPSTGKTVVVPPVSMASIMSEVRKEYPEPQAPVITVDIAGHRQQERNYNDPSFAQAYRIWEQTVQLESTSRMLDDIAFAQRLDEQKQKDIAEYKEKRAGNMRGIPTNDYLLWFHKIALGTDSEIQDLTKKAQRQADPTPEVIAEKANGFHGSVPVERRVSVPDAT